MYVEERDIALIEYRKVNRDIRPTEFDQKNYNVKEFEYGRQVQVTPPVSTIIENRDRAYII